MLTSCLFALSALAVGAQRPHVFETGRRHDHEDAVGVRVFTHEMATPFPIATAQRFDAVVMYNVARAVMDAWHRHASSTAR